MGDTYFLYGAAVQGIQNFIFQTDELKDIIGASELVDEICTSDFEDYGEMGCENSIVRAAGNIKFIFKDREKCEKAVKEFPQKVLLKTPGVTISQAVVEFAEDDFANAVNELECKLRTQRNRPMRSMTLGLMGIRRSRQTGSPVVTELNGEYLDEATFRKRQKANSANMHVCCKAFGYDSDSIREVRDRIPFNVSDITGGNDWIAIIHADGNGLGQIVQNIGNDKELFRKFSIKLDEATKEAAVCAYEECVVPHIKNKIPIRPIILSGDDLTVIIRGDLAVNYAHRFIVAFEEKTKEKLKGILKNEKGLTACAGIAFIKSSYPFYYGYELAEALCSRAKKHAKKICPELAPSCIMFHKVQDSFTERYEDIIKRELTPAPGYSFEFGPYFIEQQEGYWTIEELLEGIGCFACESGNAVKSHLRQWMSLIHKKVNGVEQARQKLLRLSAMLEMNNQKELYDFVQKTVGKKANFLTCEGEKKFPIYDILSLHSINIQITK